MTGSSPPGPGDRVGRFLDLTQPGTGARPRAFRLAGILTILAWFPLFGLAVADGVAWGGAVQVPFVRDFLPYGQLLVAIPALVLGEIAARRRLGLAMTELRRSGIVAPDDRKLLEAVLECATRLGGGGIVNAAVLVVALSATVLSLVEARTWLTGGWQVTENGLTLPGWWYLFVSLPVMRFLALRWLWRGLVWAWVLWRVAHLRLIPRPMHPDRSGGLAFLGETQVAFSVLVFVFGIQLSCLAADAVVFRGADLMAYRGHFVAFLLTSVAILLLPLLTFAPKLVRAREEQLVILSGHGNRGAEHLGDRLASGGWGSAAAENEISGLADFGALYENARLMRPLPMDMRDVTMLVVAAGVPFVPLVFLVMPAGEVLRTLARLLV